MQLFEFSRKIAIALPKKSNFLKYHGVTQNEPNRVWKFHTVNGACSKIKILVWVVWEHNSSFLIFVSFLFVKTSKKSPLAQTFFCKPLRSFARSQTQSVSCSLAKCLVNDSLFRSFAFSFDLSPIHSRSFFVFFFVFYMLMWCYMFTLVSQSLNEFF